MPGTDVGTAKTLIQRINRSEQIAKLPKLLRHLDPASLAVATKKAASLEGMLESYTQRKNVTVNLTH